MLLIQILRKTGLCELKIKKKKKRCSVAGVVKQDCIRKDHLFGARQIHSGDLIQPLGQDGCRHQSCGIAFFAALPAARLSRQQLRVNPLDSVIGWRVGGCKWTGNLLFFPHLNETVLAKRPQ